jgi:vesicle coat complex subunit
MSGAATKQQKQAAAGGGGGAGQPYFVDQKKGEVNELRMLLGKLTVQRDKRKLREVVKKVIAYMTLGIDVTRVFDQMVMACHTTDLVIKKMVYLYLTHYAAANPDLAILGINTLCKDSRDADPMVRGLAIRSLTSLRLPNVVEYVMEPIRKGLVDNSSYVRKAAVMGILKIHHMAPVMIQESDFVNQLYNMVRDADAKVVTNCLVVLNEIMREEGGVAINKKLITYLLNRISDFDEWGQTIVLDLVPKYTPRSDEEAFAFMNVLDSCLRTPNSGVALATAKAFVHFTENLDAGIRRQACTRIKSPLMTMMTGSCPETSWVVCKHIEMLVRKEPGIFDDQFKAFYCRHNDPTHIQFIKLEILPLIANPANMGEICAELTEYATDITVEISRRAVKAVGGIGMRVPSGADSIMNQLLGFLDLDIEHVTDETMIVVKNLLRKYPERGADVAVVVKRCMAQTRSPDGRAAVVWIYGEFGSIIPEAPYELEAVINNIEKEVRFCCDRGSAVVF